MPKIREDVELKELEKYGFEFDSSSGFYERKIDNKWYNIICVDKDREIFEMTEEIGYWTATFSDEEWFDTKYIDDLIKADLVEKVGERIC
jgi:hypothetical protein